METSIRSIRDQVALVARLRAGTAAATDRLATLRAQWNSEHADLIQQVALYRRDLDAAERELTQSAVDAYRAHGTTQPAPGIVVKLFTRCDYEPARAFEWAVQHSLCLMLDTRAFERIAKGGAIDCVTLRREPVATLAADLAAALEFEAAFATKEEEQ